MNPAHAYASAVRGLKKESATKLASEYGIGNSTITGLKKNADKIHSFQTKMDSLSVNKKRKIMRLAKNEDVDEAVYLWFEQNAVKEFLCLKKDSRPCCYEEAF